MRRWLLGALLLGCAPAVLPGSADLRLKEAMAAPGADIGALLAQDAEVHVSGETVKGREAGAARLSALEAGGPTELFRHHEFSWLSLGDGRGLLLQRGEDDRLTRVVELPAPQSGDGTPWQAVYYSRAWNEDDDALRLQQLKPVWPVDGRYVDATNDWTGPQGVSEMIGRFRKLVPGTQVKATTGLADAGGGWMTWDWVILVRPGASRPLFFGFDVMHLDAEGKIELLVGFVNGRRGP
mgnify:CR=1 FL=1